MVIHFRIISQLFSCNNRLIVQQGLKSCGSSLKSSNPLSVSLFLISNLVWCYLSAVDLYFKNNFILIFVHLRFNTLITPSLQIILSNSKDLVMWLSKHGSPLLGDNNLVCKENAFLDFKFFFRLDDSTTRTKPFKETSRNFLQFSSLSPMRWKN